MKAKQISLVLPLYHHIILLHYSVFTCSGTLSQCLLCIWNNITNEDIYYGAGQISLSMSDEELKLQLCDMLCDVESSIQTKIEKKVQYDLPISDGL